MNEVPCGYCEHFKEPKEEKFRNHYYVVSGVCAKTKKEVKVEGKVCKDFSLMKGVATRRKVPDYCVNRNWIESGDGWIKVKSDDRFPFGKIK